MGSWQEGITILGLYDVCYYTSNIANEKCPGEGECSAAAWPSILCCGLILDALCFDCRMVSSEGPGDCRMRKEALHNKTEV